MHARLLCLAAALMLLGAGPLAAQVAAPPVGPSIVPRPRITAPVIVPRPPSLTPERVTPRDKARPQVQHAPQRVPGASGPKRPPAKADAGRRPPRAGASAAVPLPLPRPAALNTSRRREPNVLLVAFAGGTGSAVAEAIAAANGLTVVESAGLDLIDRQIHRLRINDGRTVEEVAAVLSADQRVLSARPNTIFTGQARPAPSRAGLQYAVTRLGLAEAHASARGRGVTVAVIDTGVDAGHEALRTARIRSISVMAEKPLAQDHGTEIAGALAAAGGALTGVAPDADIVAIEAFGVSRDGVAEATAFHLVEALDRAWMERARVINMSFAGGEEPLITEMLDALAVRDVVLVAAAGNEGPKAPPAHPGAHPRVIAVTATDASDGRFAMANRGGYILLAAPGVDILAPAAGGKVRLTSGTSIATAHVSGAIALLLERRPELSAAEIRAILAATARDLGARGADAEYGAGLVDPVAALKAGLPRGLQADAVR